MKKFLVLVVVIGMGILGLRALLVSRASYGVRPKETAGAAFVGSAATIPMTPTIRATQTPIPTATVDYQSTAIIAQQTADEARRVNAIVTAQFEQRVMEQLQMTAAYEERVQQIYAWTQSAAATTIPLTATQQAVLNTQIPSQQQFVQAQWTITAHVPTQMALMADAQNRSKFGWMGFFFQFSFGIFILGIVVYIFIYPPTMGLSRDDDDDDENEEETVVWLKNTRDNGASSRRHVIPCSPDQLTEFARGVTQGRKTLAINNWEGSGTLLKRDVILRLRAWLRDPLVGFANPTKDGQLAPTDELSEFLIGWLDSQKLPQGFDFEAPPEKTDEWGGDREPSYQL
jgi:hypothetical protein